MNTMRTKSRRGVTLLELMAAIMVMSIIAAVIMPVIVSATESYAGARTLRSSTESLAFASDRLQRVIREAPSGADGTGLGVSLATDRRVLFLDGTGFEYDGTDLYLHVPGADPVVLCRGVDSFEIRYVAMDGRTDSINAPANAHRIGFELESQGSFVSGVGFPRVWIGQEGA